MRGKVLKAAAWIVTVGILAYLFWRTPFSQVWTAARAAAPWTLPVGLLLFGCIYAADSFAMWKTFGWFLARFSFGQILLVRGATYLLAAINYNVGQGAIVYFVNRAKGVPILRGVATVLLIMGVNMLALLFLASGGLLAAPDAPHSLGVIIAVAYAGLAIYVGVVIAKPRWLAGRPIFDVLLSAGLRGHLKALAVRLPHIAALVAFQTTMLRAFGVAVPIAQAIVCLPVVFFVSVLPISVQGLGTSQAMMMFFFSRYAPGDRSGQDAAVLAASLVGQFIAFGCQVLIGLGCLRSRAGRELRTASQVASSQPANTAAAPAATSFDAGADRR
ncbi:MAG TPA: lysylphosphatidylglycerol synthase domain-containing protein [Polyangia bacterium]|nr:lysylphosphatidylglycerol synthase domain-containing protein [Polyangia bacterium]